MCTASPNLSLRDLLGSHLVCTRHQGIAVTVDGTYLGVVRWDDIQQVPPERWTETTVGDILRDDLPVASPDWQLKRAVEMMYTADLDILPVVADGTELAGVVTLDDAVRLDELLPEIDDRPG